VRVNENVLVSSINEEREGGKVEVEWCVCTRSIVKWKWNGVCD